MIRYVTLPRRPCQQFYQLSARGGGEKILFCPTKTTRRSHLLVAIILFLLLALLLLLEAVFVIGVLGWWHGRLEAGFEVEPTYWRLAAIGGVGQLAIIWRQITRGAYYHCAGRVSQALVAPTDAHPDPWSGTIGGPGGPQYPVNDDGYHVSV